VGFPRESGLGAFAEEEGVVEDDGGRLSGVLVGVLVGVLEFFLKLNRDGIELAGDGIAGFCGTQFILLPSPMFPQV
jgi:hypothetical protein